MKGEDGEFPGNAGGGLVVWKGLSSGNGSSFGKASSFGKSPMSRRDSPFGGGASFRM